MTAEPPKLIIILLGNINLHNLPPHAEQPVNTQGEQARHRAGLRGSEATGEDAMRGSRVSPPRDRDRQPDVRRRRAEQGPAVDGGGGGGPARGLLGLCPAGEFRLFLFFPSPTMGGPSREELTHPSFAVGTRPL